jgi:hypothetical protein
LQRELCLCLESPELSPVAAPLLSLFPCFLNTPGICPNCGESCWVFVYMQCKS